jgi:hypothetical protein
MHISLIKRIAGGGPLRAAVLTAMLFGFAADASAQAFISPFLGFNFGGDARCPELAGCEDKTLNFGVGLGTMGTVFGFEEEFGYAKDFFGDAPGLSSSVLTLMSNLMIVPNLGPVRPYGLVGLGLIKTHVELTPESVFTTDNNSLGWDIGGGVAIVGDRIGIRGDIRYFHAFEDLDILGFTLGDEKLDFGRGSVALVFTF